LISGSVKYDPEPLEPAAAGNLLICCSRPQEGVVIDIWREIPIRRQETEFSRKRSLGAARPVFMLRVVSRRVQPEFLVVIEIVAAKA